MEAATCQLPRQISYFGGYHLGVTVSVTLIISSFLFLLIEFHLSSKVMLTESQVISHSNTD